MAGFKLHNVVKRFGQTEVIHGVNLSADDGEFVVFVGPSGCGKSTLLRIIAGLEELSEGEVWIGNENVNHVDPANRGVAMVFQTYALYPHMSVEENMGFGLRMAKRPKQEIKERVARAAEILHLTPLLKRRPKQLSGGQRQRVAIGRAIVREPKIFLFDEPLSNLDAELRVQMRIELSKLHNALKTTMVYVTHDQVEAMTLAEKIVVINHGKIEQIGGPLELYQRPANLFVAGFMGSPRMNFLKAQVADETAQTLAVETPDFPRQRLNFGKGSASSVGRGNAVTLGIRPEHLAVSENGKGIGAINLEVVEHLGDMTHLHGLTVAGNRLSVSVKGFQTYRIADSISLDFDPKNAHLFTGDGNRI
jgi:ABC-type sugar transport system ATPase subunit